MLAQVDNLIRGAPLQVLWAAEATVTSSLFAPADPKIRPLPGLLLWMVDGAALAGASGDQVPNWLPYDSGNWPLPATIVPAPAPSP